ncbi:MAG TPA: glycoside hydrolase family 30 beta sandwich domain-containing protein [Chitinophagaceae bacterium]
MFKVFASAIALAVFTFSFQQRPPVKDHSAHTTPRPAAVGWWVTTGDSSRLLHREHDLRTGNADSLSPSINIQPAQQFQRMEGFGFALTDGSATLINRLPVEQRHALLRELFGKTEKSIGISYLRISIGASDLNASVFSYEDLPQGEKDPQLEKFTLSQDTVDLVPVLKEIISINPEIRLLGSPWSAPVWMKDNGNTVGGSLLKEYYRVYAEYFVKYLKAMESYGIRLEAITPQNEPLYGGNNPSMVMQADDEKEFVRDHLGPALRSAGLKTKIIVYDHNCDRPDYPITIMNDSVAKSFVAGSAFHLYGGEISALSTVHNAHPDRDIYFTEQWTGSKEPFAGNLAWHTKNVVIGTARNWGNAVIEWNLASDPQMNPHTTGGCSECKGAVTIGNDITRNVSYYIIGHVSKFVPPGSVRIASTEPVNLPNVAFLTPAGKIVIIVENEKEHPVKVNLNFGRRTVTPELPGNSVATFTL